MAGAGRRAGMATNCPPKIFACRKILFLSPSEIFLRKSIGREGIFTLKFRKPGWVKQSKVISECILKSNFFMQTDVL